MTIEIIIIVNKKRNITEVPFCIQLAVRPYSVRKFKYVLKDQTDFDRSPQVTNLAVMCLINFAHVLN
jgi:hypothetical protein